MWEGTAEGGEISQEGDLTLTLENGGTKAAHLQDGGTRDST